MSYNLLKGKRGIIFGALNENSIAWKVAERALAEGATFTLTNVPFAIRMGDTQTLADKCNTIVIPADASSVEDLENLIVKSMEFLGGKLDFLGGALIGRVGRSHHQTVVALAQNHQAVILAGLVIQQALGQALRVYGIQVDQGCGKSL